jgi:predicted dehydrogenase
MFRYYWDYAGGMMTDWGVHLLDIVQMAFGEQMPLSVTCLGGKYWLTDDRETPDTQQVIYEYPGVVAVYETRLGNRQTMMDRDQGLFEYGIMFHGTKGTLYLDRSLYRIIPEKGSGLQPVEVQRSNVSNLDHRANFIQCVRTRQRPVSDIEICHKSTTTCHLANVSLRSKVRVDWDAQTESTPQQEARKFLSRPYRSPWRLVV